MREVAARSNGFADRLIVKAFLYKHRWWRCSEGQVQPFNHCRIQRAVRHFDVVAVGTFDSQIRGTPAPSVNRQCLVPLLARSVELDPVASLLSGSPR